MRNITFNKELFFNINKEATAIPAKRAETILDILYKTSKIVAARKVIKLLIAAGKDLLLKQSTK